MRNRWNVEKESVVGWSAGIAEGLLGEVLRLGEEHGVHRVLDAPDLGYHQDTQGRSFSEFLSGTGLPGFRALFSAPRRVTAMVAWVDARGAVAEREVADLGALRDEEPQPVGRQYRRTALELLPVLVSGELVLTITSCSDIWLPWCSARYESGAGRDDLADNRVPADRHTPRLNAFLAGVAELADRSGSELCADPDATLPEFRFEVDDRGVRLDLGRPPEPAR